VSRHASARDSFRYHKFLMPDIEQKVLDAIGKAMGRFSMLRPGDRIAVGVSGGKDSLTLLHALVAYKKRAPFSYELIAVTVEQGKFKLPIQVLEEKIRTLGIEWIARQDDATLRLIAQNVSHGCDVCSRHRRYHLYQIAAELGCSVLALGHTADDCAESLMRNILFNGRIASLPPVSQSRKGSLRLIRPLVYVTESVSTEYARVQGFLPIACVCSEKENVRREIREFLDSMKSRHTGISDSIIAALGNINLYTLFKAPDTAEAYDPAEIPANDDSQPPLRAAEILDETR
jgi:tRNA 2-thiocytidine biosynthesis protein TtcA